jgi:hypothetical protein
MSRVGCRVLLRNICFTKKSDILLVNKQLYYHPIIMFYENNSITNGIIIGDCLIMTCIHAWYYGVIIEENKYRLDLRVGKSLEPICYFDHRRGYGQIYKGCRYITDIHRVFEQMLSTDIFRICITMFEFFKANSNLISS